MQMKPTSPLSLLLFIHLTMGAPVPLQPPADWSAAGLESSACPPSFRKIVAEWHARKSHSHPLAEPHFPPHQLRPTSTSAAAHRHAEAELEFDNAPRTPPAYIPHRVALEAKVPLQSSYLLSLNRNPVGALPSKPTSALADLRAEDATRYRAHTGAAGGRPDAGRVILDDETILPGPRPRGGHANVERDARGGLGYLQRDYSDVLVVGLIVLFLVAVVIVEALEQVVEMPSLLMDRVQGRGRIRLEGADAGVPLASPPFHLQPPPRAMIRVAEERHQEQDVSETAQFEVHSNVSDTSDHV